jgi:hypothetical protein
VHPRLRRSPADTGKDWRSRPAGLLGTIILGVLMPAWVLLGMAFASAEKSHYAPGTILAVSPDMTITLPGGWADAGHDNILGSAPVVMKKNGVIVAIDEPKGPAGVQGALSEESNELASRLKDYWSLPIHATRSAAGDQVWAALFTAQENGSPVVGEVTAVVRDAKIVTVYAIGSYKHSLSLEVELTGLLASVRTASQVKQ